VRIKRRGEKPGVIGEIHYFKNKCNLEGEPRKRMLSIRKRNHVLGEAWTTTGFRKNNQNLEGAGNKVKLSLKTGVTN